MFEIKVAENFNAAHRLKGYKGKCERLHGHNWKVEVCLAGEVDKAGMVLDFSDLRLKLKGALKKLDHNYLNEIKPFNKTNPTSENIAKFVCDELSGSIENKKIKIKSVSVWETDNSCATYSK